MDDVTREVQADSEGTDRSAIIMMLTYVEAECRRLGNEEAARHAALAASLIAGQLVLTTPEPRLQRCLPVAAPLN